MTSLQRASLEEIRRVAARMCREYLTGRWKVVSEDQLIVKRISGGLSNYLYHVSLPEDDAVLSHDNNNTEILNCNKRARTVSESSFGAKEHKEVLFRVYGQTHGENALELMITESVVFALLSERNFGPKLLGLLPEGRIEEYIPARPLETIELSNSKISLRVAEKLAEIHSLNIPMTKEPVCLWKTMDRWMSNISNVLSLDVPDKQDHIKLVRSFDFVTEMDWLKTVINKGDYPICFCHNDFQEGNILYKENVKTSSESLNNLSSPLNHNSSDLDTTTDSGVNNNCSIDCDFELMIIDFEYCAYNYRGFDLSNHFLEWTFDYKNPNYPYFHHHKHQFPNKQQMDNFIVSYLKKLNEHVDDYTPSVEEIESIATEIPVFCMFSHLFWSLWSVINANSNIEFGYWEYAVARINEYKSLKQSFEKQQLV